MLAELVAEREDRSVPPHVVIVATHDRELVDLLEGVYAPYNFSDTVGSDGLSFDYRLREGAARSRNAIALLNLFGAPPRVVERARERATDLDARHDRGRAESDRD